jgi:hypothetical protein
MPRATQQNRPTRAEQTPGASYTTTADYAEVPSHSEGITTLAKAEVDKHGIPTSGKVRIVFYSVIVLKFFGNGGVTLRSIIDPNDPNKTIALQKPDGTEAMYTITRSGQELDRSNEFDRMVEHVARKHGYFTGINVNATKYFLIEDVEQTENKVLSVFEIENKARYIVSQENLPDSAAGRFLRLFGYYSINSLKASSIRATLYGIATRQATPITQSGASEIIEKWENPNRGIYEMLLEGYENKERWDIDLGKDHKGRWTWNNEFIGDTDSAAVQWFLRAENKNELSILRNKTDK